MQMKLTSHLMQRSRHVIRGMHPIRIGILGLSGWATLLLPGLVHRLDIPWHWSALNALILASIGLIPAQSHTARCVFPTVTLCSIAICIASAIDFSFVFPMTLLTFCSSPLTWSGHASVSLLLEHTRWLPMTSIVMLAHVLLERSSSDPGAIFSARHILNKITGLIMMFALMVISMRMLQMLAEIWHWPWVPNALVCAMLISTAIYYLLWQHLSPVIRRQPANTPKSV
ncbi:hypothetical protein [Glaciimonas sp. GG7]